MAYEPFPPHDDEPVLRRALREYVGTDEPPMRTTSAALIAAGRRSRRRRHVGALAGTALLVLLVATGAMAVAGQRGGDRPAPAATGTDTAHRIDAALRAALPGGARLTLRSLYPADGDTALPTAAADTATAWHGTWESTVDGRTEAVRLDLRYARTAPAPCTGRRDCRVAAGPYGTRVASYRDGDTRWAEQLRGPHLTVRVGDRGHRYGRAALTAAATSAALTAPVPAGLRTDQPRRHGDESATAVRSRLDSALRGDLPGGAALRAYRSPVPLSVTAAGPTRLPDAAARRADAWYADWTVPGQPGAPRLTLLVTAPGAERTTPRELCRTAGPVSFCHNTRADGGLLMAYEVGTGDAVERAAALLRPNGSRVLLVESVQASVDFPFAAADLAGAVTDPAVDV